MSDPVEPVERHGCFIGTVSPHWRAIRARRRAAPPGALLVLALLFGLTLPLSAEVRFAPKPQEPQEAPAPADAKKAESQPAAESRATIAPVKADEGGYEVHGAISLSYRGRKNGGKNDEDLYGYLSLDGGRAEKDDLTFHLFGRATYDLDGDASDSSNIFGSLNDVHDRQLDLHLYEAYVDLRRSLAPASLGLKKIRIGRQDIHAAYTYLLDGARFEFQTIEELGNLSIAVFGGIPEYLYESSRTDDWLAGTDLDFRPFDTTRIDIRYVHVGDQAAYIGGHETDNYASVSVRQQLFSDLTAVAAWNTIDARTRDASIRLDWQDAEDDLSLHGSYAYQASVTTEYTTPYDPYIGLLGASFAHHQIDLSGSKLFSENFGVDAGFTARMMADGSHEGTFNHEYYRGYLTVASYKWPTPEIGLSLTGEIWRAHSDDTASIGGEVTWRPDNDLRFAVGSYYSLYKYDLFVIDERRDATTVYVTARWDFAQDFRLDARLEYETGDSGDYESLQLGLTWRF